MTDPWKELSWGVENNTKAQKSGRLKMKFWLLNAETWWNSSGCVCKEQSSRNMWTTKWEELQPLTAGGFNTGKLKTIIRDGVTLNQSTAEKQQKVEKVNSALWLADITKGTFSWIKTILWPWFYHNESHFQVCVQMSWHSEEHKLLDWNHPTGHGFTTTRLINVKPPSEKVPVDKTKKNHRSRFPVYWCYCHVFWCDEVFVDCFCSFVNYFEAQNLFITSKN